MARNVSSIRVSRFNSLSSPPAGANFSVLRALARVIAESIYGEMFVINSSLSEEELINNAFEKGLFNYKVEVI